MTRANEQPTDKTLFNVFLGKTLQPDELPIKKMRFYLKIVSFTVFFCLLVIKFCCCMIGAAVDFDGLLPSRCQVTFSAFIQIFSFDC